MTGIGADPEVRQITAKFASKDLQSLITINEFVHPWEQNSIVCCFSVLG